MAAVIPRLKCIYGEAAWRWCAFCRSWFSRGVNAASSMSGGVPGPRGIVAGQSGVVSSFLMCRSWLFLA